MMTAVPDSGTERRIFELGPCRLDVAERTLTRPDGSPVPLTGRPLALLVHMLERPGRLLTKQALLDAVWHGVIVEEGSLSQAVSALRRALGEGEGGRRFIETVPGVGYRFVETVRCRDGLEKGDAEPESPSIAVLPFDDLSEQRDQAYFADGVAEEILFRLVEVASLRVIGRTSSFVFRGRSESAREIGAALGARYLLTGAVRKQGDQVRVTAQLVDAADGEQSWSERFEGALGDIFAIQDEIAEAVAFAAAATVGFGSASTVAHGATSLETHDLYLRARAASRRMSAPDMARSMELYRQALAHDPTFDRAWLGLAESCRGVMIFATSHAAEAARTLDESVTQALAHAPDRWASHAAASWKLALDHDWAGAERALARADALTPGKPVDLVFAHSVFNAQVGRIERACALQQQVVRDDPLSRIASHIMQVHLHTADREGEAEAEYRRSRDLAGSRDVPEHAALQRAWEQGDERLIDERFALYLANQTVPIPAFHRAYEVRRDPAAVCAILRAAMDEPWAQSAMPMSALAWWLGHYGDPEAALAAASRAQLELTGAAVSWLWFPCMKDVRRMPGFATLLHRLGLPDYWRASGDWGDFARPLEGGGVACT